jgi:hypothetical protein
MYAKRAAISARRASAASRLSGIAEYPSSFDPHGDVPGQHWNAEDLPHDLLPTVPASEVIAKL